MDKKILAPLKAFYNSHKMDEEILAPFKFDTSLMGSYICVLGNVKIMSMARSMRGLEWSGSKSHD